MKISKRYPQMVTSTAEEIREKTCELIDAMTAEAAAAGNPLTAEQTEEAESFKAAAFSNGEPRTGGFDPAPEEPDPFDPFSGGLPGLFGTGTTSPDRSIIVATV
ncbi:MAG TPA: hypothetical protein PKV23_09795, partial [Aestuariivirga sp.]|nr:hypothetical protein [Aestuariivirga sp.]